MAKAKRVYQVAKELGVDSKAIVAKCQAEGVPDITNHMSPVKVGLEATIQEWFSAAAVTAGGTAVETAEKVDLTKVRRRARRRGAAESGHGGEDHDGGGVAVEEAPEEAAPIVEPHTPTIREPEPTAPPQEQVREQAPPVQVQAPAAPALEAPVIEEPAATAPAPPPAPSAPTARAKPLPPKQGPVGKPNVPTRPEVVKSSGKPLHKPTEARLSGPKVVRIEKADVVQQRPRRQQTQTTESEAGGAGAGTGITRSRGPARGKGAGDDRDAGGAASKAGGKRRSLTIRRGRSADAQLTGPNKFSEQDLIELDARLRGAPGFLKQRRRDLRKRSEGGVAAMSPLVTGGQVEIAEPITIKELSAATGIKSSDVIKYLFKKGIMSTINSAIDAEAAMEVALEYDIELVVREQQTAEQRVIEEFEKREEIDVRRRPPVVTVLGHVDHGKTSLLDRIRAADVAAHEAGGITQHVGAYRITITGGDKKEKTVVFLDTPGHEAFTSMRARGANMTDIIVLVVAADDGVMPQTVESINHAKAAGVPIIVALNKIDLPQANEENIRKIYGQLAEQGLNPVEWGGPTEIVKTSATTGQGVSDLLEMLDYQADLLDLKADYGGSARGVVIEAEMQEGRGPVARVLVQQGQLKVGDFIVIGRAFGRVRDMTDDRGRIVAEAGPATPLELSGIAVVPDAGDKFYITDTLRKAEEISAQYRERERHQQLANKTKLTLDNFAATLKAGSARDLRVVVKADVQGSINVLASSLGQLGNEEVKVRVIHSGVGGINESDVLLAEASDAIIIGFHVVASQHARELAEQRQVEVRIYRVIYEVLDEVKKALEGMLEPERREEQIGAAEVREVFKIGKVGIVAGCVVNEGVMRRGAKARVVRDNVTVIDNRAIDSLRRVKDLVNEVRAGTECGLRMTNFEDLKPGDRIVCYSVQTIARKLE